MACGLLPESLDRIDRKLAWACPYLMASRRMVVSNLKSYRLLPGSASALTKHLTCMPPFESFRHFHRLLSSFFPPRTTTHNLHLAEIALRPRITLFRLFRSMLPSLSSNKMTFIPERKRSAKIPRPTSFILLKSYSGRRSSSNSGTSVFLHITFQTLALLGCGRRV